MPHILDTILSEKRSEVKRLRRQHGSSGKRTAPRRPFADALNKPERLAIIAEVKKASPSQGVIRADFDHIAIALQYRKGGADALSVLTDEQFFQGSTQYLIDIREQCDLPVLRKDFIIDPVQVEQSASLNADAMLLIVAALSQAQLEELRSACRELEMEALVEIHNEDELERAMRVEPELLGINNRDLTTFVTDLETTRRIARLAPPMVTLVSESGIFTRTDAQSVHEAGAHAILVGESLMRHNCPAELIKELTRAG
ncbi:MAG: indole-3-glycerol phosphate synthase TrpC [Chitinivibrionales bacterium]|nr:indole-3-glycerol phosphate synthase TrpC [Chitinivibrionales bacterium]